MAKPNASKAALTAKGVDALINLVGDLDSFGIFDIDVYSRTVQFKFGEGAAVVAATRQTPTVEASGSVGNPLYTWKLQRNGARLMGCLTADELPSIGYQLVDGKPVPVQSATA